MFHMLLLAFATLAAGEEGFTELLADEKSPAEYGYHLSKKDALDGWIALFDGKTTFGWRDAELTSSTEPKSLPVLIAGTTTSPFAACDARISVVRPGKLRWGPRDDQFVEANRPGIWRVELRNAAGPLSLADGLTVSEFAIRPIGLSPLLNGKDLTGWKVLPYPNARPGTRVAWEVKDGHLLAKGGPGALELQEIPGAAKSDAPPELKDFVLQVDVRTAERHTNGGIFLRNQPGTVMMGYEAQLHNRVYDTRKGQGGCCTGSVDDRQHARKLVSRDGELFRLTAIIAGPHLSIWVNGYQTCDWTDTREPHENPRRGLRLAGGTLQLQAHDPETNLEFHQVLLGQLSP
jgi:hypothetical protein